MEQYLLTPGPLLNEDGDLSEEGYATSLTKVYDRLAIKASPLRIKEWDYYYIGNKEIGVALTIADNGYMGLASVSLLRFGENKGDITKSMITLFPKGKLKMPPSSTKGDVIMEGKGYSLRFLHEENKRRLLVIVDKFGPKKEKFRCDVYLQESNNGSMVIATPFAKKHHFYYNQKINNLHVSGYAKLGEEIINLSSCQAVLDWGRGVWTYNNIWYWSSASGESDGHQIGWNLGYGFGKNEKATENMLFVDGVPYKLDDVKFDIPINKHGGDSFLESWDFRSSTGDISLRFEPILDRHADMNLLFLRSNQHQVFGIFHGYFLINGKQILIEDVPGFAEKVHNRW